MHHLDALKDAADPAAEHAADPAEARDVANSYAALKELRGALEKFRRSGKPIHAYLVNPTTRDYYLASAANSLVLNPQGMMLVNGLVAQTTYYAGALEKYGVGMQVVRVGKYKSFVEPFIRTNMSPESREQNGLLLGAVWDDILQTVALDRKLDASQIQTWVDKAEGFKPEDALARKLVDKLAYFDEELAELKKISGQPAENDTFPQIELVSYAAVAQKKEPKSANKIAVLYAEGAIMDGHDISSRVRWGPIGAAGAASPAAGPVWHHLGRPSWRPVKRATRCRHRR
jgi:protease-4